MMMLLLLMIMIIILVNCYRYMYIFMLIVYMVCVHIHIYTHITYTLYIYIYMHTCTYITHKHVNMSGVAGQETTDRTSWRAWRPALCGAAQRRAGRLAIRLTIVTAMYY